MLCETTQKRLGKMQVEFRKVNPKRMEFGWKLATTPRVGKMLVSSHSRTAKNNDNNENRQPKAAPQ